ncbi:MAG: polyribonucleotide nucleotidyltransferase [Chloroflexi bacterium]|nr:polyribonucleotide nucleotidyltransferase [Chloroflexota bacterium]
MTPTAKRFTAQLGEREIVIETGHLAQQAGAAITIRDGDTMLLVTATMGRKPREGIDFMPLSVDFEERLYAVGRIPGNWFRREGRPPEMAILSARLTDRPLRPLFPKNLRNEVQVIITPLVHDQVHHADVLGVSGASVALTLSNIPWDGPIGAVRVGLIDNQFVLNPTYEELAASILDLRMAASRDAIIMVECAAEEVDEATMVEALEFGHAGMQGFIALQEQMREELGKPKYEPDPVEVNETLRDEVTGKVTDRVTEIVSTYYDRDERAAELEDLREQIAAQYEPDPEAETGEEYDAKAIQGFISDVIKDQIRRRILHEGVRPDGRDYTTIRALSADVDVVPRAHGTGLFQRGETQVMSILTLGTLRDAQELDGVDPINSKRYIHHYNFPPYSTGETAFLRGPRRREIGHGALAENAVRPMIPDEETFPYAIRIVSEVLSSNGSTSMASVCGSTLALMAAGVPIKQPIAGIAMGLIKDGEKYAVLTDIQGMEDHLGDMDFKVAGSKQGITALQMDIKIKGISPEIMQEALEQARQARLQILDVILECIAEPRKDLSPYAPRIITLHIDVDKIGAVIGKGGETVRALQEETGVRIDIEKDGTIYVASTDGKGAEEAVERILALTEVAEVGRIYTGRVVRVEQYGAFVEILPGTDGLVHISQLASEHVKSTHDVVQVGDEIMVMVTAIDSDNGKVRLSRQAVLEGWTIEEAIENDRPSGGSRGGGSRGRSNRGGGDRGSGGGDRNRSRSNRGGGDRGSGGGDRNRSRSRNRNDR